MTDIQFRSDFDVDSLLSAGSDQFICQAARVSVKGAASFGTDESAGLINFLMKNRHGSPFEHGMLSFLITAPIFVWREFMRHRIGFSYNEESGRYKVLDGVFYITSFDRQIVQVGKPGAYSFEKGSFDQYSVLRSEEIAEYRGAWASYQRKLDAGIAKEVARNNLPFATYSSAYVTCNPRSLMSFLSLRTKDLDSTFPSFPLWEIEQVARQMEIFFEEAYPLTYKAFNDNGRVAP